MTWHVLIDGEQKGPFEADTVAQMIGRGEVTAETLVWTAGIQDWTRAIDVPEFAENFPGAAAAASQPLRYGAEAADEDDDSVPGRLKFGRVFSDTFKGLTARPGNTLVIMAVYAAVSVAVSIPYYVLVAPKIQTAMETPDQFDVAIFGVSDLAAYLFMAVVGVGLFGGLCAATIGLVRGEEVPVGRLFTGFQRLLSLIGYVILFFVMVVVGTLLLILPGVFVWVSMLLGMFIIMDRGSGAFAGMKSSIRATLRLGWFRMFGLILVLFVAIFAIFLVIGIIAGIWFAAQGGLSSDVAVEGAAVTLSLTYYVIQTLIGSIFAVIFFAILAAAYKQAEPHLDAP
jgi:hypothetical protein